MKKIIVFVGTRPKAIMIASVIQPLHGAADLTPITISTGQHREMLRQVIDTFGIRIDHHLQVMQTHQTLSSLTARLMTRIDKLLARMQSDMVLVQGDTTTVLIASLACYSGGSPWGTSRRGCGRAAFGLRSQRRLIAGLPHRW